MNKFKKYFESLSALHWLVVCLSLLLTLTAWQISSNIATEKAREEFDHQVTQLNELLRDRMHIYEFSLISGAGAIKASGGNVSRDIWRGFSESLALDERLPGINGIGVIERVAPDALDAYLTAKQQERSYFKLHPTHERQDYWPIVYIEPEERNRAAVGLDMAHENNRYQAAVSAMETGQTRITGPIVLVQDAQKTPGFLFYHPFYESSDVPAPELRESQFKGLVYAPFIMSTLMGGTLASASRQIDIRISDGDQTLFSELDEQKFTKFDDSPMFSTSYLLNMYGREWKFDVQTSQVFETYNKSSQPTAILIGGIIIDALILIIFTVLATAHHRAKEEVSKRTLELQDSLNFSETLTNSLPLAVTVWDPNYTCRFMNAYGERWFKLSSNEAAGQIIEAVVGNDTAKLWREYYDDVVIKQVSAGKSASVETSLPDVDGNSTKVIINYYPVLLDGELCTMATIMDVTERVQREIDLKRLNRELDEQKREAESAVTMKSAFLANMSHEIRTPMNAIIGVLVLLKEAGLDRSPKRLVDKAYSAAEALLHLLNDILDFSKIEADRIDLNLQPFEIDTLIHRSVDVLAIVAEEKELPLQLAIDPETPNILIGDVLRITQICTNLIGNAIKFTQEGQITVRIAVERSASDRGVLIVEVADTGIGISPEKQSLIFDKFRQADESTSRNYGGTGLGLSISSRLSHLMGGELSVESQINLGSTFRLTVPVGIDKNTHTMGELKGDHPIHVVHHGFGLNLALLEDYEEHWGLHLEALDDLSAWPNIFNRISSAPPDSLCFIIDQEGADRQDLKNLVAALTKSPDKHIADAVLIVAPAGRTEDWLEEFQRLGGRLAFEPLTPSRLYEHLGHRLHRKEANAGSMRPQFSGLSVLVVDDVPLNCEIVETYLNTFGVETEAVLTGDNALALLKQRAFDLVLMDLHLDGETGQNVTARILAEETVNKPIIVALSASISDQDRILAKQAGMKDYITKPVIPDDIQLLLETYFDDYCKSALPAAQGDSGLSELSLPECIDPVAFQRLFGQDNRFFERCVRSFVSSSADMLIEAREATTLSAVWKLAHKIKGAAGNIADTDLAEQASLVEQSADEEDAFQRLAELITKLEDHLRQFEAAVAVDDEKVGGAPASEEVLTSIERVKDKLNRNRIAGDNDIRSILSYLAASGRSEMASRFRQAIEAYDFKEALLVMEELSAERNIIL